MGTLVPSALRKHINSGQLDPVYLVLGADEYEKDEIVDTFESVVEEELRPFNVDRFDGLDAGSQSSKLSLGGVLGALQTLPMMAPKRVVIAQRAELLLQPKRESESTLRDLALLEEYLDDPAPTTTLVLIAERLDERRRISKSLKVSATVIQCGELKTQADAVRWITRQAKAAGVAMEPGAVRELSTRIGPDVRRLRGELDRLFLFASGQERISESDVREVAGAAVSLDDWAVTDAIQGGETATALRELALLIDGGAVPQMLLGQLAWVVRTRLSGQRLAPAIDAVFRADSDLKRSAAEPRVLLEKLVIKLCAAKVN